MKIPISYQSNVKAVSQSAQKEREYDILVISKISLPSNTNNSFLHAGSFAV